MGYVRHFLAAFMVLLVASCQPAFAQPESGDNCETVPKSKIDEGIAIARSGLYPQMQVLTGRHITQFLAEIGLPGSVFAAALIETGSTHLLVTAAQRGAKYIVCRYEISAKGVALFRRHAEAAT